jgi:hypothetical protein
VKRTRVDRLAPIFALAALALWLAASFANTLTFWEVPAFRHVTIALLACAAAFGLVYLPIVVVRALARRRSKRAISALGGMAVLLGCFAVSPLGPGAFRLDSWLLAYAKGYRAAVLRQPARLPRTRGPAPRRALPCLDRCVLRTFQNLQGRNLYPQHEASV